MTEFVHFVGTVVGAVALATFILVATSLPGLSDTAWLRCAVDNNMAFAEEGPCAEVPSRTARPGTPTSPLVGTPMEPARAEPRSLAVVARSAA